MEDIILKCERIEKKYSKTKALDNINLSIYTGHIYALIGENGAGKTTLKMCIRDRRWGKQSDSSS